MPHLNKKVFNGINIERGRRGKQRMTEKEIKRWFELKEVEQHEKMNGEIAL